MNLREYMMQLRRLDLWGNTSLGMFVVQQNHTVHFRCHMFRRAILVDRSVRPRRVVRRLLVRALVQRLLEELAKLVH
jgi:hypothetical protein